MFSLLVPLVATLLATPPAAADAHQAICADATAIPERSVLRFDGGEGRYASATVVGRDRVVTASHSLASEALPWVIVGQVALPAYVVRKDIELDVATLAVPTPGIEPLRPGDSRLSGGDSVLIVGYSHDGRTNYVPGRIDRVSDARIYVNAPIAAGYSGGAILHCVDGAWSLAGVVVGYNRRANSNSMVAVGVTMEALQPKIVP